MLKRVFVCAFVCPAVAATLCRAVVVVDTSIGATPPPAMLGGYAMEGFGSDPQPLGPGALQVAPPPAAPVVGNLIFSEAVSHYVVGAIPPAWVGWSHGYAGDVYHADWTGAGASMFAQRDLTLPAGTLAFYLYLEPETTGQTWAFNLSCSSAAALTGDIVGMPVTSGAAQFIGFYTDDPTDPLTTIHVEQTTMDFLGFGIGEFGINVIPEPRTWALFTGIGLLGLGLMRRVRL